MRIPLFGTEPLEMGMTEDLIISRLRESDNYKDMFSPIATPPKKLIL